MDRPLLLNRASVVSWNVAHQIYERPIALTLGAALAHIGADVIFLTEFVDGASRKTFRDQLTEYGYVHQTITSGPARHNHVFAASRLPFRHGDIKPPVLTTVQDQFAQSNFLHLRLMDSDLELIGVRAPFWNATTNRVYRRELASVLRGAAVNRALVVAGDINIDPFKFVNEAVSEVPFPDAGMYSVVRPQGPWSFTNYDGSRTSRIDHVFHTPRVEVSDVRYIYRIADIPLAGPKAIKPLSDHAALTFTATVNNH